MRAPTPPLRILLSTDGSDDARRAAHWLAMLPVPAQTRIRVVSVVTLPPSPLDIPQLPLPANTAIRLLGVVSPMPAIPVASEIAGTPWAPAPEIIAEATEQMKQSMAAAESALGRAASEREVMVGNPASQILDAARTADLVVMGARGLGVVARMVIGSVSERVLQHADGPVLIVKGKRG